MNRYYYCLLNNNNDIIGYVTSFDLRYRNENQRLLCCGEELAQYVMYNNQLYKTYTFSNISNPQDENLEEVAVVLVSKDEYEKYMK